MQESDGCPKGHETADLMISGMRQAGYWNFLADLVSCKSKKTCFLQAFLSPFRRLSPALMVLALAL